MAEAHASSAPKGWVQPLLSVLWSVALAIGLTWPMALQPGRAALGSVHADGMKHLWTLWWMRGAVWDEGRFPFFTQMVNWPVGMDLYPIEPLNGLASVLTPGLDIVVLSNLLILVNMVLTGLAGGWFGRLVSGSWLGGMVAGTLLEGSSVMAFFVHVGVGELTHLWWLPLGLGMLVKAREALQVKWFAGLFVCLVGSLLSCFYLGLFLALATALWALSTLWAGRKTPKLLVLYALTATAAVAAVLPIVGSFSSSYQTDTVPEVGLESYVFEEHGQPVTDPPSARLWPAQLVTPGREADRRETKAYGGGRYLGAFTLLLGLAGLVRRPKKALPWLAVGVVGIVLSTGTYLTTGEGLVTVGSGARVRMPVFYLNRVLGYLAEPINFPVRFLAMTSTALSAMAALALAGVSARRQQLAVAFCAILAVGEVGWGQMLDWPWATFQPRESSALKVMRSGPHRAVLDLALVVRTDNENRWNSLSTQIAHGKPTHAVPIERIEYFARDGLYFVKALGLVEALEPLYQNRDGSLAGDFRGDITLLRDAGFEWIVVSYRNGWENLPTGIVREMTALLGKPVARSAGLGAWQLPELEHTAEELETWKAAHAVRVKHVARMTPGMGPPKR